ncbi:hypothetical protein F5882DRAFT_311672 [Hyaloscypha sp. PMI_1271]|nr:hypothetical protein F5882DRAFT_311672 [Hyaloscypha sp. PMI_1271]
MPPPPIPNARPKPSPRIITAQPSFTGSSSRHPSLTTSRFHQTSAGHSHTQTQSLLYSQPQPQVEEVERPPFSPFFTLINDASKEGAGETIHPRKIHYIFSDDDTSELLTSSLIHSLHPTNSASASQSQSQFVSASRELSSSKTSSSSSAGIKHRKPAKEKAKAEMKEREERVVIVDINEDGTGVKSVSSLCSTWQVLNASISNAPTFDSTSSSDDPASQNMQERGLMLRIEGVGVQSLVSGDVVEEGKKDGGAVMGEEEMSILLDGFDRKMGVLRKIIESRTSREDLVGGGDGLEEREDIGGTGGDVAEGAGRRESGGSEEREVGSG